MRTEMILFDLDGTLLPMDMDVFTGYYFRLLAKKAAPRGYTDARALIDGVWAGTAAMVKNDGSRTNEEAFWAKFAQIFGERVYADKPLFDEFYANEFNQARSVCGCDPRAREVVELCKALGFRVALATNPLFPDVATVNRARWAGLDVDMFELYTTYENSTHCKPNLDYYRDVIEALHVPAGACLMVGNDAYEDMIAEKLGMKVFLLTGAFRLNPPGAGGAPDSPGGKSKASEGILTSCLINKAGADIDQWPHGDFDALMDYLRELAREREEA